MECRRVPARSTLRRTYVVAVTALCPILVLAGGFAAPQKAPHQKQSVTQDSPPRLGRQAFDSACAACHGLDGRGSERGPNIATRPEVLRLTDRDILVVLRDGIPSAGMPAFASLGSAKLSALLGYVRTLQGKGITAEIPGDPKNGQHLFFGSARCSECHIVFGKGGFLASDLTVYAANLAASEIRSAITNPGDDSSEPRTLVTITLYDGHVIEGIVRNEDNFSLQLQSIDGTFHLLQKSDVAKVAPHAQSLMPTNYSATLAPAELDDLVGYLMTVARQSNTTSHADIKRKDDDE